METARNAIDLLFDFTRFFAWTFLYFLARCGPHNKFSCQNFSIENNKYIFLVHKIRRKKIIQGINNIIANKSLFFTIFNSKSGSWIFFFPIKICIILIAICNVTCFLLSTHSYNNNILTYLQYHILEFENVKEKIRLTWCYVTKDVTTKIFSCR